MDTILLAKYIINYAIQVEKPISYLQLEKIIYLLNGKYFTKTGTFLVDEDFFAYPAGPATNSVRNKYRSYGANKIRSCDSEAELSFDTALVNSIIDNYLGMPILDMHELVKEDGKSYYLTKVKSGLYSLIKRELIEREFKST